MKTQHLRSSAQQSPAPAPHERQGNDWKSSLRLNALDLNPLLRDTTTEAQPWVYGEPQLMRLLQVVGDEVASLNTLLLLAGEPVLPCEPVDLLHLLGLASSRKPDTWQSNLRFGLQLLIGLVHLVRLTSYARLELAISPPAVP